MASYQILYWMDIPSQIKVFDDFDEIKVDLGEKFITLIDKKAKATGLIGTDDYLAQWNWSEEQEMDGDIDEVAQKVKEQLIAANSK